MRKYLILLVALVIVLGISGIAMAQPPWPVNVSATVNQYCSVTAIVAPGPLTFVGTLNEIQFAENGSLTKECNVATTLWATVTTPLTASTGQTINTQTKLDSGVWGSPVSVLNPYTGASSNHTLGVWGQLGAIAAQPAGGYLGVITVTVTP